MGPQGDTRKKEAFQQETVILKNQGLQRRNRCRHGFTAGLVLQAGKMIRQRGLAQAGRRFVSRGCSG